MTGMQLSEAAAMINAEHIGDDAFFSSVSTDTRSLSNNDLFIAICGEKYDGHDYISQAKDNGAVAAMVSRRLQDILPMLLVPDTRLGLGQLASVWRDQRELSLVAITGSNGKTTVKEMLASILSQQGKVLATKGNLNNDIGMPLTLLEMQDQHQFAVIEMGANHQGEINYLSGLAKPDVALITNAGAAHLEGFGSIEGVAQAKGEIFSGLGLNGIAVINADDAFADYWKDLVSEYRVLTFGTDKKADLQADWKVVNGRTEVRIVTPMGEIKVQLQLPGRHNVMNALAAATVAYALDVDNEKIRTGLERTQTVKGRLQLRESANGMNVLDDTYNANPSSLKAALDVLSSFSGRKWLILGDMAELGESSEDLHRQAGVQALESGVERLYLTGRYSKVAAESFGAGAQFIEDRSQLAETVCADWNNKKGNRGVVLVKGSRSMHMEEVVDLLMAGNRASMNKSTVNKSNTYSSTGSTNMGGD